MPTLKTCPKTGNYIYRKTIPEALRPLVGRGNEWKVSLGTKSLAEARVLFTAEAARCEAAIALARASLRGESSLLPADAPKLADRWIAAELAAWEHDNELICVFLAHSGGNVVTPLDVMDEECPSLQVLLADAMRKTLAAAGHPVPSSTSSTFSALHREFFLAWRTLCETALQRHHGDWRTAPAIPAASLPLTQETPSHGRIGKVLRLSEVTSKWVESKRQDSAGLGDLSKTIAEYTDCMQRLIFVVGDIPASQVTKATIHHFRVTLGHLPKGRWKPGLTLEALRAQVEQGAATMELATIRKKLAALATIFKFACERLEALDEEPVAASGVLRDLRNSINKAALHKEARDKGYNRKELIAIFGSPLFHGQWKPQIADYGQALYWLPLLMAYTGARREEVAQLLVSDVEQEPESGIWCLAIRPGDGKSLKTASSRRRVPLHDDLVALGFLDYRDSVSADGRLFPKLKPHKDGFGHAVGKTWDKYLQEAVKLQTTAKPAHGFRHAFKTLCREVGIPKEVHDWLTGHAASNVGDTYGSAPISRMAEELKKFPSIARMAGLLPR
ncbi:site-specific integrase [Stutzerimonas nitrititolerans]|uniref:site-specific integrase n=1 Tax=Stutzerimonas nitrititolerans TaxID=2482751 RepID=UPI0028B05969|nr:site-specific integrase [Stutzerimonas nitrititolerans]